MFFNQIAKLPEIAKRNGTSIFVVPDDTPINIDNAIILQPDTKSTITIDQVRDVMSKLSLRQNHDQYIIIRPADLLNEEAEAALLKNLEEPKDKIHFILVTSEPSRLLPTILSRAALYYLRTPQAPGINTDTTTKNLAKNLLVAKGSTLVTLAETIAKHKDHPREYAMSVVGTSIEMLYQTYFITKKPIFLNKLPHFLSLYDALSKNGHIKLQIISNLA